MPISLEELVVKLAVGNPGDSVTIQTKYQDKIPFDMEYVGIKVITNEGGWPMSRTSRWTFDATSG